MNRVLLTGKLTNDFAIRSEKLATCSIAVSKDIGKGTEYIDIVAFNNFVEIVKPLKKGTLVFVEGTLTIQKVNEKKYAQIVIKRIEALINPKEETEETGEEDLPF